MTPLHTNSADVLVLGGGCFWCIEATLKLIKGVIGVRPGYMGGRSEHPTYPEVCQGQSGHIEVVEVTYDSTIVSTSTLLTVFFASHDPTSLDRQDNDIGHQYRSIIFWTTDEQYQIAKTLIATYNLDLTFGEKIVTELRKVDTFWCAEAIHHDYFAQNSLQGYCRYVISPKVDKIRAQFANLLNPNL